MGVPQKKVENKRFEAIKRWFEDFKKACKELLNAFNAEVDEYIDMGTKQAVEEAIQETKKENPEIADELDKIQKAINYQQDRTENGNSSSQNEKDEDGYNKIPDKVGNIKAEVSEEKAIQAGKQRAEGGKQKTRIDED